MTTVYVNWKEQDILTEKEYEERIDARVKVILNDEKAFRGWKEEYLESNYKTCEIFDFTEEDKEKVLADIKSDILDWVADEMGYSYDEITLDI
jgi:hypothetical protein